jgi:PAS domain S-box-containing protein
MRTLHALTGAFRTWRLRNQLLAWLLLVVLATLPLVRVVTDWRIEQAAREHALRWAGALARAAAADSRHDMDLQDERALDSRFSSLARLPGVLHVDLTDAAGKPWRRYVVGTGAQVVVVVSRPQDAGALGAPLVWAGERGSAAQVGIAIDPSQERLRLTTMRDDLGRALLGVTTLAMALLYGLLWRALLPLQRVAGFARRFAGQVGSQLQHVSGSAEIHELTQVLNDTSASLGEQFKAAAASEGRTALLTNAAPDALLALDADGRITLINHAVTSVFGCTEEQILGAGVARLLPGFDADELERATLAGLFMRSTGMHLARIDTTARRHDGTEFPAEASISRVETAEGTRYACVVRDLTEQRMTLSMLELYNRALECTTTGVVISDMSLPNQPLFYANPAFTRITGYEVWEAIGKNCAFLHGKDKDQPELDVLRQAIAQQASATVVLRNYRKDGSLFFNELAIAPVRSSDGSVRHYVGIQTDVSERERSRLALAERSARLNTVFDLSPDGYAVFDSEGVLVFGNQALRRMTGWDADTVASGMSLADFDARFAALCDPARPYMALSALQSSGSCDTDDLLELVEPQRCTLTRLARLNIDGRGESILYFRDVTREMEVDRMKSEFLTTAAHELRTPMVSVFGFTELLLNRPVPETRRRDVLETIHRQASLLISMVNELLDLARIEARQGKDLVRRPVKLGPLLHDAVAGFMPNNDTRRVLFAIQHADTVLLLDAEKAHRALSNVLSNAYKYSPGGGEIELRTLDGEVKGEPAVGIRISDRGIGMSPDQVSRVFERFYRADPSGNIPGTGLGMSLVKEITELQGGRIDLDSAIGVGTQVTLWFPIPPAGSHGSQPAAPALANAP